MPLDLEESQEAPSDLKEGTQKALSDLDEEAQQAQSDPEKETKYIAGPATGSTDLEGPVVPVLRMLTISGNLPPNNVIARGVDGCTWT